MSHERQKATERDVPADPAVILVGIDPALDKHGVVAMRTATCARLARYEIPNSIAGMQGLEKRLVEWREQADGGSSASKRPPPTVKRWCVIWPRRGFRWLWSAP